MRTISGECPNCAEPFTLKYKSKLIPHTGSCNQCGANWSSKGTPMESCSFCGCRYFYRQKDFNHLLGCGIVILGGFIVPAIIGYVIGYRYFLIITICSLSVFTAFDVLLYRHVADMAICYDCRCEFRGFDIPPKIEQFEHFLAERFEKDN